MVLRQLSNHYQRICSSCHRLHRCLRGHPCMRMAQVLRVRQTVLEVDMVDRVLRLPLDCRHRPLVYLLARPVVRLLPTSSLHHLDLSLQLDTAHPHHMDRQGLHHLVTRHHPGKCSELGDNDWTR